MTKMRYVAADQGHAIPQQSYNVRSIWDPAVIKQPSINYDHIEDETPVPMDSTAQNDYKPVKWYECRYCGEILRETHLDGHQCEIE